MHYYKKNIGDYHKKAGRLSMLEHGAYTLLLDACYDRERFPTLDEAIEWAGAVSQPEVSAVSDVLKRLFRLKDGVYFNDEIATGILQYHSSKGSHWANSLSRSQRTAIQAARNAAKKSATPKWLTSAQNSEIDFFYKTSNFLSRLTGVAHEVDHIVPIRGRNVCGLHAPWNLQVITAAENRQKSNSEVLA